MPETNKFRILFVLNPVSGKNSKAEIETEIRDYFKEVEHEYEWYQTTGNDDAGSVRHWVDEWKPDRVVAVGGDGTLKLVAEVLHGSKIPVGIIPAGSANGMARELGLPQGIRDCLDIIVAGACGMVDAININGETICLHLSDIGLNAQLVKHFEENGWKGKLGYVRGIFKLLWKRNLMQIRIKRDGETLEREAFMVVLANARMYGTGAVINPDGDIGDGVFELIIMRRLSFIEIIKMFLGGKNFNRESIEIVPVKTVEIQVMNKGYFQVDGEYIGKVKNVQARIEKHALCMMKPVEK